MMDVSSIDHGLYDGLIDGFALDLGWICDGFVICMGRNLSALRLSEVLVL